MISLRLVMPIIILVINNAQPQNKIISPLNKKKIEVAVLVIILMERTKEKTSKLTQIKILIY